MRRQHIPRPACAALALAALSVLVSPAAAQQGDQKSAAGITVYLGVLPAAMILGHPKGHPEPTMHGGVPRGRNAYHVLAAVFDAASGQRIENARVEARVAPLGLAAVTRPLEPMRIAGTVTYGNYFTIRANEPYRIRISVARGRDAKPIMLEFTHEHRTR